MSSAIHDNWLHHFRHLRDSATPALDRLRSRLKDSIMPATTNGAAETLAFEQTALEARAEAPSRYVEITKDVLAGREPATTFARLSAHGVSCEVAVVLVTPEIAERYLKNRSPNRHIKPGHLQFLVRQMKDGEWKFTGETLIFDENNQLLDGQHRCSACAKSGVPFLSLVVRYVPRSAYDRIDLSAKRTNADVLSIEGVSYANIAAAAVARLLEHRRSGIWYDARSDIPGHEIFRALPDFPGIEQHFIPAKELTRQFGGGRGMWAAARYLTFQQDAATAQPFWEKMISGVGLEPGDPELRLRQRLLDLRLGYGKVELTPKHYGALIVASWNYRRRGRSVQLLRVDVNDAPVPAFL
jgi:hypothetical protein